MKIYYLIAEKKDNFVNVRVSGALRPGHICLMEIPAKSFSEASKSIVFSTRGLGKSAICGVKLSGEPYAEMFP